MHNFRINPSVTENIISDISSYLCYYDIIENYETAEYPMWTVEIINQEGKIYKFNNHHFIFIDDVNHEEYISNKIPEL